MPLNDSEIFEVMFDVRTQGVEGLHGLVTDLKEGEDQASRMKGQVLNLRETIARLGAGAKDFREVLATMAVGGDQFTKVTQQIQYAAHDTLLKLSDWYRLSHQPSTNPASGAASLREQMLSAMVNDARSQLTSLSRSVQSQQQQVYNYRYKAEGVTLPARDELTRMGIQSGFLPGGKPLTNVQQQLVEFAKEAEQALEEVQRQLAKSKGRSQTVRVKGGYTLVDPDTGEIEPTPQQKSGNKKGRKGGNRTDVGPEWMDSLAHLEQAAEATRDYFLSAAATGGQIAEVAHRKFVDLSAKLHNDQTRIRKFYDDVVISQRQLEAAQLPLRNEIEHKLRQRGIDTNKPEIYRRLLQPGVRSLELDDVTERVVREAELEAMRSITSRQNTGRVAAQRSRVLSRYKSFAPIDVALDVETQFDKADVLKSQARNSGNRGSWSPQLFAAASAEENALRAAGLYRGETYDRLKEVYATGIPELRGSRRMIGPGRGEEDLLQDLFSGLNRMVAERSATGRPLRVGAYNPSFDFSVTQSAVHRLPAARKYADFYTRNAGAVEIQGLEDPFLALSALWAEQNPTAASRTMVRNGRLVTDPEELRYMSGWGQPNVLRNLGLRDDGKNRLHTADFDARMSAALYKRFSEAYNSASSSLTEGGSVDWDALIQRVTRKRFKSANDFFSSVWGGEKNFDAQANAGEILTRSLRTELAGQPVGKRISAIDSSTVPFDVRQRIARGEYMAEYSNVRAQTQAQVQALLKENKQSEAEALMAQRRPEMRDLLLQARHRERLLNPPDIEGLKSYRDVLAQGGASPSQIAARDREIKVAEAWLAKQTQVGTADERFRRLTEAQQKYRETFGSLKSIGDIVKTMEAEGQSNAAINSVLKRAVDFYNDQGQEKLATQFNNALQERQRIAKAAAEEAARKKEALERAERIKQQQIKAEQFRQQSLERRAALTGGGSPPGVTPELQSAERMARLRGQEALTDFYRTNPEFANWRSGSGNVVRDIDRAALEAAKKHQENMGKLVNMAMGGGSGSVPPSGGNQFPYSQPAGFSSAYYRASKSVDDALAAVSRKETQAREGDLRDVEALKKQKASNRQKEDSADAKLAAAKEDLSRQTIDAARRIERRRTMDAAQQKVDDDALELARVRAETQKEKIRSDISNMEKDRQSAIKEKDVDRAARLKTRIDQYQSTLGDEEAGIPGTIDRALAIRQQRADITAAARVNRTNEAEARMNAVLDRNEAKIQQAQSDLAAKKEQNRLDEIKHEISNEQNRQKRAENVEQARRQADAEIDYTKNKYFSDQVNEAFRTFGRRKETLEDRVRADNTPGFGRRVGQVQADIPLGVDADIPMRMRQRPVSPQPQEYSGPGEWDAAYVRYLASINRIQDRISSGHNKLRQEWEEETRVLAQLRQQIEALPTTTPEDRALKAKQQEIYASREGEFRTRHAAAAGQFDTEQRALNQEAMIAEERYNREFDAQEEQRSSRLERMASRKKETITDYLRRTGMERQAPGSWEAAVDDTRAAMGLGTLGGSRIEAAAKPAQVSEQAYERYANTVSKLNARMMKERQAYWQEELQEIQMITQLRLQLANMPAGAARDQFETFVQGRAGQSGERFARQRAQLGEREEGYRAQEEAARRQMTMPGGGGRRRGGMYGEMWDAYMFAMQFTMVEAAIKKAVVDVVQYAARTETLKIVTEQMANANKLNTRAVLEQVEAVKHLNISTQEAHETVQRMMFAQLDVRKATELARVAQNAAVISNEVSSVALEKIITGIVTGQTRLLHNMGLQVSMLQVIREETLRLGRAPSELEKRQAMLNKVLSEGTKIQGNYDAAMMTASKQQTSLVRQWQEAQNAIGEKLTPSYMTLIGLLGSSARFARDNSDAFAKLATVMMGAASAFIVFKGASLAGAFGSAAGTALLAHPIMAFAALAAAVTTIASMWPSKYNGVAESRETVRKQIDEDEAELHSTYRRGKLSPLQYNVERARMAARRQQLDDTAAGKLAAQFMETVEDYEDALKQVKHTGYNPDFQVGGFTGKLAEARSIYWHRKAWNLLNLGLDTRSDEAKKKGGGVHFASQMDTSDVEKAINVLKQLNEIPEDVRKKGPGALPDWIKSELEKTGKYSPELISKTIETFKKMREQRAKGPSESESAILNMEAIVLSSAQEESERIVAETEKLKKKKKDITQRLIERTIKDPLEKIDFEIERQFRDEDLDKKIADQKRQIALLPLDKGLMKEYRGLQKEMDAAKLQPAVASLIGQYAELIQGKESGVAKPDQAGLDDINERLKRAGLTPQQGERLAQVQRRMNQIDSETRGAGALQASLWAMEEYQKARSEAAEKAREEMRDAYYRQLKGAAITRASDLRVSQIEALAGPGLEEEQRVLKAVYEDRIDSAKKAAEAEGRSVENDTKVLELQKEREIALNNLVKKQREELRQIEVNTMQAQQTVAEAIITGKHRGSAAELKKPEDLTELYNSRITASQKLFDVDKNRSALIERNNRAETDFQTSLLTGLRDRADSLKNADADEMRTRFDRARQLIRLQAINPAEQMAAEKQIYELRIKYAEAIYDKKKDDLNALSNFEKEKAEANFDYLQGRLEIYRKQMEDARNTAGKIYDVMMQRGQTSISEMIKGMFKSTGRTIFQNIFVEWVRAGQNRLGGLIGGQTDAEGKPSWIGKALAGTILQKTDKPDKEILERIKEFQLGTKPNVDAVTSNTEQLKRVEAALAQLTELFSKQGITPGTAAEGAQIYAGAIGAKLSPEMMEQAKRNGQSAQQALDDLKRDTEAAEKALREKQYNVIEPVLPAPKKPIFPEELQKEATDVQEILTGQTQFNGPFDPNNAASVKAYLVAGARQRGIKNIPSLLGLIEKESNFRMYEADGTTPLRPTLDDGTKGNATGIGQLIPRYYKGIDVTDPKQNIEATLDTYASLEKKYKDPYKVALAYEWGSGNVDAGYTVPEMFARHARIAQTKAYKYKNFEQMFPPEVAAGDAAAGAAPLVQSQDSLRTVIEQNTSAVQGLTDALNKTVGTPTPEETPGAAKSGLLDRAKSALGIGTQPGEVVAYSRVGRNPIRYYNDPASGEAGKQEFGSRDLLINSATTDEASSSTIIKHEDAHSILQKYLPDIASDKDLAQYIPKIRKGLSDTYGDLYKKDLPSEQVISEAMAYYADGRPSGIPGLSTEDEKAFIDRAMKSIPNETAAAQYKRLVDIRAAKPLAMKSAPLSAEDAAQMIPVQIPTGTSTRKTLGQLTAMMGSGAGSFGLGSIATWAGGANSIIDNIGALNASFKSAPLGATGNYDVAKASAGGVDAIMEQPNWFKAVRQHPEAYGPALKYAARQGGPLDPRAAEYGIGVDLGPGKATTLGAINQAKEDAAANPGWLTKHGGQVMRGVGGAVMGYEAYKQFSSGQGASGILKGAGATAGMVGAILPMLSKSLNFLGPAGMIAGTALSLIGSLFGNNREKRRKQIEEDLKASQYTDANTIEYTRDIHGRDVDFDYMGRVRTGALPNSGPSTYPQVTVKVDAMDSKSFMDRSGDIANALRHQLVLNHPVSNEIKQTANT